MEALTEGSNRGFGTRLARAFAVALALAMLVAGSALGAWHQPVGGPSPINESADQSGGQPSLTSIDGVPYVAWVEESAVDSRFQVHVARLNATGTAWEKVGESTNAAAPINQSATRDARGPSLTEINGVPYVAWSEPDSLGDKIRVARLNAAGTAWEKVGQTASPGSPINQAANRNAGDPSLTAINGVPYVAWSEEDSGSNNQIRVARLNAAGTAWEKVGQSTNPASPINAASNKDAYEPSLVAIDGVPYVAWSEEDAAANAQIRVARLNATSTAWEKVGETTPSLQASPINQASDRGAYEPDLIVIDGVPYVAWEESSASGYKVRVARLNAAGAAWEKVGQTANPASPINWSADSDAFTPTLAAIGGVPYIAWMEDDAAGTSQVRVARLDEAGTGWEKVADAAAPINASPSQPGHAPSLAAIGGVPYVASAQYDGTTNEIRVSRLEPEIVAQSAVAGPDTATLSATWRTYGVPFPIGFDYGNSLESATTPTPAPAYVDSPTVTQQVSGLAPSTVYQFRSFALAGSEPRLFGDVAGFTTAASPDTTPPETTITKDPSNKLKGTKAKYKFTSSEPNSTFTCKFDKGKFKPCDSGKAKYKHLDDGKHKFKVIATDAAGNADPSAAKDKFKVL
jgi:hypothetical protein